MKNTLELAAHGPVIPVIVLDRVEDAVPLARALLAGGVRVLEVTLRTPVALACIEAIARARARGHRRCRHHPLGGRCPCRASAGSAFGVSPGYTAGSVRPAARSACRCCPAWPPPAR